MLGMLEIRLNSVLWFSKWPYDEYISYPVSQPGHMINAVKKRISILNGINFLYFFLIFCIMEIFLNCDFR